MCERCGASLFAPSWDQGIRGRGRGLRARAHLILHSHSTTKRSTRTLKLTLTCHPRSSHPPYEKGTLPMATRRTFAPRKPFVSSPSPPLNCGPPLVLWSGAGPKVSLRTYNVVLLGLTSKKLLSVRSVSNAALWHLSGLSSLPYARSCVHLACLVKVAFRRSPFYR